MVLSRGWAFGKLSFFPILSIRYVCVPLEYCWSGKQTLVKTWLERCLSLIFYVFGRAIAESRLVGSDWADIIDCTINLREYEMNTYLL